MLKNRSFWALMVTQLFGAFNDNLFKVATGLMFTTWVTDLEHQNRLVALSGIVFVAPFILFSLLSGRLADRFSKSKIIVFTKVLELGVVIIAAFSMFHRNIPLMLFSLALFALQNTVFGPAKFGLMPEILPLTDLPKANSLLVASTFLAILGGSIAASLLSYNRIFVSTATASVALAGFLTSLLIRPTPSMNPQQPLTWNPIPDFRENWKLIRTHPSIERAIYALSYFWFAAALLQMNTIVYVKNTLEASDPMVGLVLAAVLIGIVLGGFLAGTISRGKIELGIVPFGALGLSIFSIDLLFATESFFRVLVDAVLLGFSAGIFAIPLETLVQARSPEKDRGRVVATVSFLSFIAVLLASVFLWVASTLLKADPPKIFFLFGFLSLIPAIFVAFELPHAMVRLLLFLLTNTIYRIRVYGAENVPSEGPVLLVPNHISFVDAFLIGGATNRLVRFLMYKAYYETPWIKPLVKLMKAVPISGTDSPKEIMRSLLEARERLKEGRAVAIFPEGELSLFGGELQGFKKGLEVIVKNLDVPVVPVHLEGVWGSIFSYKDGKFFWKWPKKFPYPVTISFGKPILHPTTDELRQAVMDLGADAFKIHRQKESSLFYSFLRTAKFELSKSIVADSSGLDLSYHQLLTAASVVGSRLSKVMEEGRVSPDKTVGVLLPPSVEAAVVHLALTGQGYIPVHLNYTLSREAIHSICEKAGVKTILTAEKFLSKLGREKENSMVLFEDIEKDISSFRKIIAAFWIRILPTRWLERFLFNKADRHLEDVATLIFTSGSTGTPKGVMLTEMNILSNIQALQMILPLQDTDVFLGVLPFFHSFGLTACFWFPLVASHRTVYHANPLDSKTIGELVRDHHINFLVATPTFLNAYLRKIPSEYFASLKFAIAGAEKLRPDLAKAFEERYKVPLLEGYGCTELSPVVAINLPNIYSHEALHVGRKVGKIGRPIPGISIKIVDPSTYESKKTGEEGLLLVRGPNVMKGYWREPEKTKEAMHGEWYVTGDIAKLDEDGFIEITDRLSRFSKIGGEMVPHIRIEEKLHELAGTVERLFVVTSVPDERKGESLVVLTAGFSGDLDQLWKALNNSDLPKLWIPDRDKFFSIEEMPVLGSGKLDMQKVKALAVAKCAG